MQEKKKNTCTEFSDDAVILTTCISHTTAYKICVRFISMVYMLHWKINVLKYSNSYDVERWQYINA